MCVAVAARASDRSVWLFLLLLQLAAAAAAAVCWVVGGGIIINVIRDTGRLNKMALIALVALS